MFQLRPPTLVNRPPPPAAATLGVWALTLSTLGIAGLLASSFTLMATSLDPSAMVTAGVEPWIDSAKAAAAFAVLVVTTALALVLWHSARLRAAGLVVAVLQACAVAWACLQFYDEYF